MGCPKCKSDRLKAAAIPAINLVVLPLVHRRRYRCADCGWTGWKHRLQRRGEASMTVALQQRDGPDARALWFFIAVVAFNRDARAQLRVCCAVRTRPLSKLMHILHVVGARPNFMKAAPVHRALAARGVRQTLVHTGQHYDSVMSDDIFGELGLPEPDVNLGIGSGSHAQQTGQVMIAIEEHLSKQRPDLVLVYGDVNSTMAATIAAVKLGIAVGHVEAGLRSGDRSMPEEINRLITDRLSNLLFTPSTDGDDNLLSEGTDPRSIRFVGNVMIDTLQRLLPTADGEQQLRQFDLMNGAGPAPFVLVTLHRPSNVDDPAALARLMGALEAIAVHLPVVFPVHPRTKARLAQFGIRHERTVLSEPLTYLPFLGLQRHAAVVVTDSGGIQEETTYLGIPCLTMRPNTERPVTVTVGTNQILGSDTDRLEREVLAVLDGRGKKGGIPELWDGHAADRIADALM